MEVDSTYIRWFDSLSLKDIAIVGGKNSSIGEMTGELKSYGIKVPGGYATTVEGYYDFLKSNKLDTQIKALITSYRARKKSLEETGRSIRRLFNVTTFPTYLAEEIRSSYQKLSEIYGFDEIDVAVRSSATAEGLSNASFAGQLESFLNIVGEDDLLDACRKCYASLFTDRAIAYREKMGFDHLKVGLSIGIQKMVRSDKAGSGVIFTVDTESGFPDMILINAAWGLGDNVVQGIVNPDQYLVFKPLLGKRKLKPIVEKQIGSKDKKKIYSTGDSRHTENVHTPIVEQYHYVLNDDEILQLATWGSVIEHHYKKPMNIEWAKDGITNELFIVQARPETVQSHVNPKIFKTYNLKERGEKLLTGLSIGSKIANGRVHTVSSMEDLAGLTPGCIIVAEMTEPDWVPALNKIAGIVTDYGGRTCHAAIISRELGIPAVVGTGEATQILSENQHITLSCAEGEQGIVYAGKLNYIETDINLDKVPDTKTGMMLNITDPFGALKWWRLPVDGIGLARMEYLIKDQIKIHPMALAHFEKIKDEKTRHDILELTKSCKDKTEYFIDILSRGLSKIAASQYPLPVMIMMSDFRSHEYRELIGGTYFEPIEKNSMWGWRGASRYYNDIYRDGFSLECRAVKKAREEVGLDNIIVMIPFCRTPEEADRVLQTMDEFSLKRGERGLKIYMRCELPANIILTEEFAKRFDGFSIGSVDLTQMILGVERDMSDLSIIFNENIDAVKRMIENFIRKAHKAKRYVSFSSDVPGFDPDYSIFLVEAGIDSISVNPDNLFEIIPKVFKAENEVTISSNV
jgi:pyruvate,water dikinase